MGSAETRGPMPLVSNLSFPCLQFFTTPQPSILLNSGSAGGMLLGARLVPLLLGAFQGI